VWSFFPIKFQSSFSPYVTSLLGVYLSEELEAQERIIYVNEDFVVLIPFWAVWPFETMIIPKKQSIDITAISKREGKAFAEAISAITKAFDELFGCSFPYVSDIHQAPTNKKNNDHWHWHMSFYPLC
jgi:UDPglucose--hexose-1-phosphate uridylyltransferase